MRQKHPYVATLDQVKITRHTDEAIIEYAESGIYVTHLQLGPCVKNMTDQEILDCFNDSIIAREQARADYEHIAVEIPPGKQQIEYFAAGYQWTARGDVLRCRYQR